MAINIFCTPVYVAASQVKGDPELIWQTPLGSSDIENNAYNRCRLVRLMKPGVGKNTQESRNNYDIISTYISDLYAQSVKISAYIAAEDETSNNTSSSDLDNEKTIIEQEIIKRMADISRRLNIINSFESGILVLDSLQRLRELSPIAYAEFRALVDGKYQYVSDCEVLKK